jgi:(1->4)-alpha-D-glucan 1-alpha-D-glucosylmutase
LVDWASGRIKLYVTWKALCARRSEAELFRHGEYLPLQSSGTLGRHVVAFARSHASRWAITAAPRLTVTLARARDLSFMSVPLGKPYWREMTIEVPEGSPDIWTNVFTGEVLTVLNDTGRRVLPLSQVFDTFPVSLLLGESGSTGV